MGRGDAAGRAQNHRRDRRLDGHLVALSNVAFDFAQVIALAPVGAGRHGEPRSADHRSAQGNHLAHQVRTLARYLPRLMRWATGRLPRAARDIVDTGDLVRVKGDDLVWLGRSNEDFLNTGHGVKISLAELRAVIGA